MEDRTHGLYPLVAYSVCVCWVEVSGLVRDDMRGSASFNFEAECENPLMTCLFQGS